MENVLNLWDKRHAGTQHFRSLLAPNPKLSPDLHLVAVEVNKLAEQILDLCLDGPELSAGLRKLLEAKDCFVRQALLDGAFIARHEAQHGD